ncbi:hypothetical protein HN031_02380 [Nocardioides sp. zg-1308]|uniref:PIN-like domain-containing protein n=1 Tax=Nocardioides sp. zg-1308 TaxID=2736253 RepID=UPI0015571BD8|nr:hypothetical protein [Nocardioides sp. zg-1308]NPD03531.1 hypothetical protein [Nocardioides sp. zg-1308]
MTADKNQLRFFVDESSLGLGKALAAARKDTIHTGHPLIPECPLGTPDPEWIPIVAEKALVVIGRDKKIRTRPAELQAIKEAGLRVFLIGGKGDLPTWDWLTRIVRAWPTMEAIIEERPDGPWIYVINAHGLVEVKLLS